MGVIERSTVDHLSAVGDSDIRYSELHCTAVHQSELHGVCAVDSQFANVVIANSEHNDYPGVLFMFTNARIASQHHFAYEDQVGSGRSMYIYRSEIGWTIQAGCVAFGSDTVEDVCNAVRWNVIGDDGTPEEWERALEGFALGVSADFFDSDEDFERRMAFNDELIEQWTNDVLEVLDRFEEEVYE